MGLGLLVHANQLAPARVSSWPASSVPGSPTGFREIAHVPSRSSVVSRRRRRRPAP
jgi:hypothetical protein